MLKTGFKRNGCFKEETVYSIKKRKKKKKKEETVYDNFDRTLVLIEKETFMHLVSFAGTLPWCLHSVSVYPT